MTDERIQRVIDEWPELGDLGFDNGDAERLLAETEAFDLCLEWLKDVRHTKGISRRYGSYALKHWVERASGVYIPNGVFIAAAIHAGYRVERIGDSPNAFFNMHAADLRRKRA